MCSANTRKTILNSLLLKLLNCKIFVFVKYFPVLIDDVMSGDDELHCVKLLSIKQINQYW